MMMCVTSFISLHFGTARSSENQRAMIEALAVLISQPHNTAQEQIPLPSFVLVYFQGTLSSQTFEL